MRSVQFRPEGQGRMRADRRKGTAEQSLRRESETLQPPEHGKKRAINISESFQKSIHLPLFVPKTN